MGKKKNPTETQTKYKTCRTKRMRVASFWNLLSFIANLVLAFPSIATCKKEINWSDIQTQEKNPSSEVPLLQ